MRYYLKTFGCQMNKHDSERIAGLLEVAGFLPAESVDSAEVIIINTCAVRENAVKRLKGYLQSLGVPKRKGAIVGVGGCVAQVEKEKLLKELKFVDFVFGPDNLDEVQFLIAQALKGRKGISAEFKEDFFASSLPSKRETAYHAWVAITKGCDNYCTYCIVPFARGRLVSRELDEILKEARRLKDEGVLDITLLGQNVNAYGKDLYGEPRFVELLSEIANLGFRKVSFATSHPADFQEELVSLMMEKPNISRQLHLPVQSGSNKVLKRMNRGYTRERYLEIVKEVRKIPDLSLTTDIIVGFPGETEEDFQETLSLIKEASFDHVFTFIFSPRPNTEAATYKDQVPDEVKKERFQRLTETVKETAFKQNLKLVGKKIEAVVEGRSKTGGFTQARTDTGKIVLFKNGKLKAGERVSILVKEAGPYHLVGELAGEN